MIRLQAISNPTPIYVIEWLKSGRHASSDAPTGKTSKKSTVADSTMAVFICVNIVNINDES